VAFKYPKSDWSFIDNEGILVLKSSFSEAQSFAKAQESSFLSLLTPEAVFSI